MMDAVEFGLTFLFCGRVSFKNKSYFSLSHLPTTPTSEKNVTLYGNRVAKIYEKRGYQIHRNERGEVIVPRSKM